MQEMYAFAMTCYEQGLGEFDLDVDFMAQPPFDEKLAPFDILHYTFGQDFDEAGRFVPGKVGFWHWDKRDWSARPPPVFSQPPPAGCQNELTVRLVEMINRATGDIECWDEYHKSGAVHYKVRHRPLIRHAQHMRWALQVWLPRLTVSWPLVAGRARRVHAPPRVGVQGHGGEGDGRPDAGGNPRHAAGVKGRRLG